MCRVSVVRGGAENVSRFATFADDDTHSSLLLTFFLIQTHALPHNSAYVPSSIRKLLLSLAAFLAMLLFAHCFIMSEIVTQGPETLGEEELFRGRSAVVPETPNLTFLFATGFLRMESTGPGRVIWACFNFASTGVGFFTMLKQTLITLL